MPDQAEYVDFFALLGLAIGAWQRVESAQFVVFSAVVGSRTKRLASAFHNVPSFRAKLDMTDMAMKEAVVNDSVLADWSELYKTCVKKGKQRNGIAHSLVYFDPSRGQHRRFFLAPSSLDPSRFQGLKGPKGQLVANDLKVIAEGFSDLSNKAFAFGINLEADFPGLKG